MKLPELILAFAIWPVLAPASTIIMIDLDTGLPILTTGQNVPFDQASGGMTASFSTLPGYGGFSVQNDSSTKFNLSQFSGYYLSPNGLTPGPLDILFSQPLTSISFVFATANFHEVEIPTTIRVTGYLDSTGTPSVGSASGHGAYGSDTMPMGILTFNSLAPFNLVEIDVPPFQTTSVVLVDSIAVTPSTSPSSIPEPTTVPLLCIGLVSLSLLRHRR